MPFGLPGWTMIAAELWANTTGAVALLPASVSLAMLLRSAEAKRSAGAPSPIWVTSSDEAAKLSVTVVSGLAAMKASARSVKAAVNDAAAKTVMSPDGVPVASVRESEPQAVVAATRPIAPRRRNTDRTRERMPAQ